MSEIRPHIVVEVMQAVQLIVRDGSLRESLQSEWLIGEKKAEEGSFVLTKTAKRAYQNGQHGRMKGVQLRSRVHQSLRRRGAQPAEVEGPLHRPLQLACPDFRNFLNPDIDGGGDDARGLFKRRTKNYLFEAPRNLLPFALRRLVQVVRVGIKSLMQKRNDEERFVRAARRCFRQTLQQEDILALRMKSSKLQELSQLI